MSNNAQPLYSAVVTELNNLFATATEEYGLDDPFDVEGAYQLHSPRLFRGGLINHDEETVNHGFPIEVKKCLRDAWDGYGYDSYIELDEILTREEWANWHNGRKNAIWRERTIEINTARLIAESLQHEREFPDHEHCYDCGCCKGCECCECPDEDQDDFKERLCEFCGKEFTTDDFFDENTELVYDEEKGVCYCNSKCARLDEGCAYCATIRANPDGEYDPPAVNGMCYWCAEELEENDDEF